MTVPRFHAPGGHFYANPFPFDTSIHKDVSERLEQIQPELYAQVKEVLEQNKQERHIRGGMATKRKYELKRQQIEEYNQNHT